MDGQRHDYIWWWRERRLRRFRTKNLPALFLSPCDTEGKWYKATRESGCEQSKLVKGRRHCRVKEVRGQLKLTVTVLLAVEGVGRVRWAVQAVRWPMRNETVASDSAVGFLKLIQSSHRCISRLRRRHQDWNSDLLVPALCPCCTPHSLRQS